MHFPAPAVGDLRFYEFHATLRTTKGGPIVGTLNGGLSFNEAVFANYTEVSAHLPACLPACLRVRMNGLAGLTGGARSVTAVWCSNLSG